MEDNKKKRGNTFNKNAGLKKTATVRVMDAIEEEMVIRRRESIAQLTLNAKFIKQSEGEEAADEYMDKLTGELDQRLEKTRQRLIAEQKKGSNPKI